MSKGDNKEFDEATERQMDTPPMEEMPDFEPLLSKEQYERLQRMPSTSREIVQPIMESLSISEQRTLHTYREGMVTRSSLRHVERRGLDWKNTVFGSFIKSIIWLLATVGTAAIMAHFKLL